MELSRLLPGALGQTPGLFTGPRPQAWPPLPPRRPAPAARPRPMRRAYREQPRAGRSLVGRGGGGDGGRGGGGKGVTTAAAGQVRQGRGRTRGGAGLRPGPRSRRPRGSDHPGVGTGGGERVPEEKEEEPKIHCFRAPPAWCPPKKMNKGSRNTITRENENKVCCLSQFNTVLTNGFLFCFVLREE